MWVSCRCLCWERGQLKMRFPRLFHQGSRWRASDLKEGFARYALMASTDRRRKTHTLQGFGSTIGCLYSHSMVMDSGIPGAKNGLIPP